MSKPTDSNYQYLDLDGILWDRSVESSEVILPSSFSNAPYIASSSAIFGTNMFLRHALANVKSELDLTKRAPGDSRPFNKILSDAISKKGAGSFFTQGVSSRFYYYGFVLVPALEIGERMKKADFSKNQTLSVATLIETLGGGFLEIRALQKRKPEIRNFAAAFQGGFLPFAVRNVLGIMSVVGRENNEKLSSSFVKGAITGSLSAVPDSIATKVVYKLATESKSKVITLQELVDALEFGCKEVLKHPAQVGFAAIPRMVGGAISAVLLAEVVRNQIASELNKVCGLSQDKEEQLPSGRLEKTDVMPVVKTDKSIGK